MTTRGRLTADERRAIQAHVQAAVARLEYAWSLARGPRLVKPAFKALQATRDLRDVLEGKAEP